VGARATLVSDVVPAPEPRGHKRHATRATNVSVGARRLSQLRVSEALHDVGQCQPKGQRAQQEPQCPFRHVGLEAGADIASHQAA